MPKKIDLTGQKFGRLTVLHEENPRTTKEIKWTCQCDCGKIVNIRGYDLRSGKTQSCGCLRNERIREAVGNKLEGQKFGRLTVIKQVDSIREPSGQLRSAWECLCDCGNTVIVKTLNLKAGDTLSCGCYNKDKLKEKRKDLTNQRFGKLTVLEIDEDYMNNFRKANDTHAYWKCKCDCGNYKTISSYCLLSGTTMSCGCLKSHGEQIIGSLLKELPYTIVQEYFFEDLKAIKPLRFDFAIFEKDKLKCLIEYNGEQHYQASDFFGGEEGLLKQQKNDQQKIDYCKEKHIPLIVIPYTELNKINLDYIKEKINGAEEVC